MVKKKLIKSATYKKGTEISDINDLKEIIEAREIVYCKNQTIYDDGSQSITVEIHFNPQKIEK